MKDEVPPALIDAHVKSVEEAMKEGKKVDVTFGLDKSGIAGTAPEKEDSEAKSEQPLLFRVPMPQGKWQNKIPVRENTGNLENLPKHRDTGNLVCSSCKFPDS